MTISAGDVKKLREKTGAGMMDCKKALEESGGDFDKAIDYLRQKGLSAAQKKSARVTSQGQIGSYIHMGGKIGVLVEINCETDFVGRTEQFSNFVKDVAMQIAAANPLYVRRDDVPESVIAHEKEIYRAQAAESGKPEKVWDKMIEGKLNKWFAENCLVEQPFVKDPDKTIDAITKELIGQLGENVVIRRFVRFQLGEGLETRKDDLAEEVKKQIESLAK
ncbi:MAG: translation elongation factor Ts [Myxococcota bacterium]